MIYLLYGNDSKKSGEKLRALLDNLASRKPDATVIKIEKENWRPGELPELILGQGLFEKKYIVVMDHILDMEGNEAIFEALKEISLSENIFIFIEGDLTVKAIKSFENTGAKIQKFNSLDSRKSKTKFNIFSIADATGRRDKKTLWTLCLKALETGHAPEEIHGIIFWQVKTMILASSGGESGMNPFVWRKASAYAKNFTSDELKEFSSRLISIYHDAHRGVHNFDIALEKFILSI